MNLLTCNRMVATFVEKAVLYGPCETLAESLNYAWTSIYTDLGDAEDALAWMKANVIGLTPVTSVHERSPAWLETAADVPHNREELAFETSDMDD